MARVIADTGWRQTMAVALFIAGCQLPAWAIEVSPAAELKAPHCRVSCLEPHGCCPESEKVIGVLRSLIDAYVKEDRAKVEAIIDDECTSFNEKTKELIVGKANILRDVYKTWNEHAAGGPAPLVSFVIDQPWARLSPDGQECTITFWARREFGGPHPYAEEAHAIDVFIKRGDAWKKLHCRGAWKRARS
jgi:hypothetical protein